MIIHRPIAKRITSQIVLVTNSELIMICLWVFNQLLVHCLKTGFIFWLFFPLFLAKKHLDPQLRIIHTQWLAASMRGASHILLGPALRLDDVEVQSPRIGRCGVRLLQCDLLIFKSFQKQWRGGRGVRVITHWKRQVFDPFLLFIYSFLDFCRFYSLRVLNKFLHVDFKHAKSIQQFMDWKFLWRAILLRLDQNIVTMLRYGFLQLMWFGRNQHGWGSWGRVGPRAVGTRPLDA